MMRSLAFLGFAAVLHGQPPAALEEHFQGRPVKLLVDMPGDDSGVDVYAREAPAGHQDEAGERLTKYGPALRRGQAAEVTLVKRKGDHIEFHLNGGGFTNRQLLGLPGYDSVHWGMSEEERRIRNSMIGTRDKARRRRLESEYDRVRRRRVRPLREQLERDERARHGSRFNIRFGSEQEAGRVTAEELGVILRPYLEMR
ncbi:hypothetical protein [Paludibaculum fermentans]|uniref:hypothetical protein n=1 Tax=Paludibaculum fermentans TaxID=1473598 RepID=UPI003EBEF5A7